LLGEGELRVCIQKEVLLTISGTRNKGEMMVLVISNTSLGSTIMSMVAVWMLGRLKQKREAGVFLLARVLRV
jgi:hypothetical protein